MRRRLSLFSVAVIVATGAILFVARPWQSTDPAAPQAELRPTVEQEPEQGATAIAAAPTVVGDPASDSSVGVASDSASIVPPGDIRRARLVGLSDGDSFDIEWLDTGTPDTGGGSPFDELRLMGIDAPEFDNCFGRDARGILGSLIGDNDLLVEVIEDEYDRFGRVVANVWVDDLRTPPTFVNLAMVRAGAAIARSDGGDFADQIRMAQRDAGFDAAGLWQDCVAGDGASDVFILDLHEDAEGRDDQNENGEWIEIANAGSTNAALAGWQVRDESTFHRFDFPDGFVLEPGASVRIRSGFGTDSADELYWNESFPIWNNAGDTGYLINDDGLFVDTWTYPR